MTRRRALQLAAAGGLAAEATAAVEGEIPEETAGPFPASFGSASGTAEGVPLSVALTIIDVAAGGTPREGAAVYLWPCDREGRCHFEVYPSLDRGRLRGGLRDRRLRAERGQPGGDLARHRHGVADGYSTQLGTAGGSPEAGMTLALNVGV
jgi:hypothetical protein